MGGGCEFPEDSVAFQALPPFAAPWRPLSSRTLYWLAAGSRKPDARSGAGFLLGVRGGLLGSSGAAPFPFIPENLVTASGDMGESVGKHPR